MKYKITISYDGTGYVGWQSQKEGRAVSDVIERAIGQVLQEKITIVGASRTDSGVHALGQVAHFSTEKEIEARRFLYSVNALLPRDIRILDLEEVPSSFHAQKSASSKLYYYHLYLEKEDDPFSRLYHYHFPHPLSISLLSDATKLFVGTNDFTSFANKGSSAKTFERSVYRFDLVEERGGLRFECEGNGFLYKMVRNMVGASIDVARGKMSLSELAQVFSQKERQVAPPPAPARGLFLIQVNYLPLIALR